MQTSRGIVLSRLPPTIGAPATAPMERTRMVWLRTSRRVLIVDDDAAILRLVSLMLTNAGHTVQCASAIAEAQVLLIADDFDVVVTDVVYESYSEGLQFARAVRQQTPATRVVLLTGMPGLESCARAAGVTTIIQKPFLMKELLGAVEDSAS